MSRWSRRTDGTFFDGANGSARSSLVATEPPISRSFINGGDESWDRAEDTSDDDDDDDDDAQLLSSMDGESSGLNSSSSCEGEDSSSSSSSSFSGESSDTESSYLEDGWDLERQDRDEHGTASERQEWGHDGRRTLMRNRKAGCSSRTSTDNSVDRNERYPRDMPNYRNENKERQAMSSYSSTRNRSHKRSGLTWSLFPIPCGPVASRRATTFLLLSAILWVYVQLQFVYLPPPSHGTNDDDHYSQFYAERLPRQMMLLSPEKREALRQKLKREAEAALGAAAASGLSHGRKHPLVDMTRHAKMDRVQEGCVQLEWQTQTFPICNNVHEIDLPVALHMKRRGPRLPDMGIGEETVESTEEVLHQTDKIGYLGSGLWRSVFKIDTWGGIGRFPARNKKDKKAATPKSVFVGDPGVLKMMKMEHAFDQRNLDRHRRDALVMEKLSSSPNVVSIYAYCGDSVLTEFSGFTLDRLLYSNPNSNDKDEDEQNDENDEEGGREQPSDVGSDKGTFWTRDTPIGRVRLARGVFRGLADLHEVSGGPILHADITARQFLVDEEAGALKLNDFNRCRFVTRKNDTIDEHCPIYIKDAPGANRSPEEYRGEALNEKIDVFSAAHILYRILTGKKPWEGHARPTTKKLIEEGRTPLIEQQYQVPGTSDAVLANLTLAAYEVDPTRRKSAAEILQQLEELYSTMEHENLSS